MGFVSLAQFLVLIVPMAEPATAWAASAPVALPKAIATRQTLFSIPFQVTPSDDPRREASEVQLYVSTDRGASWSLYGKVEPTAKAFLFRAGGDGEYWFMIRTVDRGGQARPPQHNLPGLVVVVDTHPPALQLEAHQGDAGQIMAKWQMTEPYPNLDHFRIQYRLPPSQQWQPVAVDRKSVSPSGQTQSGELAWWPKMGADRVEIRAEAADTAGNVTVTHAQVNLKSNTVANDGWRSSPTPSPATVAMQAHPPIRNQFVTASSTTPARPRVGAGANAPKPKMVNTRVFELDYALDTPSLGPSGRVELWGTPDGGRTWSHFGTDDDGRSPMLVTTNQEGIYGFRIVVQNGRDRRPPQPGEPPQLWMGVDLSRPTVEILGVEQGTGDQAGQLIVRWRAEDRMLAPQPITLLFSNSPGGPWMTVASKMANTGQYAWRLDSRVPSRLYLRLEACDEAGNIGICETPRALELQPHQANVQIRDVRPLK